MAAQRRTQSELAEALKITLPMVGRRMRGEADFTAPQLAAAADLLGVTVDDLLGRAPAQRAS